MEQRDDVLVCGWGLRAFGRSRDGSTPRDWVREVAAAAIADAGLEPRDIDSVVVASESDFFSLQLAPAALLADEAGLAGRPLARVEMGGASGAMAVRTGYQQVLSGLAQRVLVVGFEHAASHLSGDDVRLLYGLSFDADLEGFAGATAASLYALSIALHMQAFGTTERELAHVAVKNRRNALGNPLAHKPMSITVDDVLASPVVSTPYKRLDCSLISDGAAALVLGAASSASAIAGGPGRRPRVRIAGSGCASDRVRLGDRAEPHRFVSKAAAAAQAYRQAGVVDPAARVEVAEVYDAFTGAEIQSIEALGLAGEGRAAPMAAAGEFDAGGRLPVNLSGGLLGQGGPPGATGIMQVATVARLLSGCYEPALQPARLPRLGVADAHGGCATVSVTHVLERID